MSRVTFKGRGGSRRSREYVSELTAVRVGDHRHSRQGEGSEERRVHQGKGQAVGVA